MNSLWIASLLNVSTVRDWLNRISMIQWNTIYESSFHHKRIDILLLTLACVTPLSTPNVVFFDFLVLATINEKQWTAIFSSANVVFDVVYVDFCFHFSFDSSKFHRVEFYSCFFFVIIIIICVPKTPAAYLIELYEKATNWLLSVASWKKYLFEERVSFGMNISAGLKTERHNETKFLLVLDINRHLLLFRLISLSE